MSDMQAKEEKVILVCQRVETEHGIRNGSTSVCENCGHGVYLAPTSVEIVKKNPKAYLCCMSCAVEKFKDAKELRVEPLSSAQVKEIVESLMEDVKGSQQ